MESTNDTKPSSGGVQPYQWFIGLFKDGTYHFIPGPMLKEAEVFIGKVGGAVFTHAGYLIFASSKRWYDWISKEYEKKYRTTLPQDRPPHIDVPNIDCVFTEKTLAWLKENNKLLKEKGGKYYEYIPRH